MLCDIIKIQSTTLPQYNRKKHTQSINLPNSSGCNIAVTKYIIAIETKNMPVGVRKVP